MVCSTLRLYWLSIDLHAHLVISTNINSHFDGLYVYVTHSLIGKVEIVCNWRYLKFLTDWCNLDRWEQLCDCKKHPFVVLFD